jgi:sugar phosphate isomerase/epimerase
MFLGAPELETVRSRVLEHDFEAVEIALPLNPDPIPGLFVRMATRCARGIGVPVAFHEALPLALATRDRNVAARIRSRLDETLRLARDAGARLLTLHTTSVRTIRPLLPGWKDAGTRWLAREMDTQENDDVAEAQEVFVRLLQEMGPAAASAGVTLAVENNFRDTRYFGERIDSIGDVLELIRRAGVPGVGACFDVYKAMSTEPSVPEAIRRCGSRIVNVHLSDYEATDTTFGHSRRALGRGAIDWASVLQAFRDVQYDGPMILEMHGSDEDLRISCEHLRAIEKQRCGPEATKG